MNLEQLKNKSILLFGKPRAFSKEEFSKELHYHQITLVDKYCEDVALVIDGKMMTPYEQNDSDSLYEKYSKMFEYFNFDFDDYALKSLLEDTKKLLNDLTYNFHNDIDDIEDIDFLKNLSTEADKDSTIKKVFMLLS